MPSSASLAARRDLPLYTKTVQRFGRIVTPMLNDIPKGLAFAHIMRVNPTLDPEPGITWDQRKGFMRVTHAASDAAGISWTKVDDLNTNAYIWGWDLNTNGPTFYNNNSSFFTSPSADFWKCVYAQHVLGPTVFGFLWQNRDSSASSQYQAVSDALAAWGKHIAGWDYVRLKKTVFAELPYVFEVATLHGGLASKGYGIRPVLPASKTLQTLLSGT